MRSLLDTNILVYTDATDDPVKQRRAIDTLKTYAAATTAVVSTQVLQEFANLALRKLRLPPDLIRQRLAFYSRFDVMPATPELIAAALDLHVLRGLSFCDALIIQAAIVSGCRQWLSQDMQHGASFGQVRIVNPFLVL